MAHYADLTPCTYFGPIDRLLAVGWLEKGEDYPRGELPDASSVAKLAAMIARPWQPGCFMGWHDCSFCRLSIGPRRLTLWIGGTSTDIDAGVSNIFVPAGHVAYVAPSLMLHYLDAHDYALPEPFLDAVRACPPMGSTQYLRALKEACPGIVALALGTSSGSGAEG